MRHKPPSVWDAIDLARGIAMTLLALAAFSAAIRFGYEGDRAGADLIQNLLLADHVLNKTCSSDASDTVVQKEEGPTLRCAPGTSLLREILPKLRSDTASSGSSRLFGLWLFSWKVEALSERDHSLWLQSERLSAFISEQRRLSQEIGDAAPRFFILYTDLDRLIQPRPDRHGVIFASMIYRKVDAGVSSPKQTVERVGPGIAVSTWFFARELRVFRADTIEASAVDAARASGYSSKTAEDAYATLTAAVARPTVTIPVANMQLPPKTAGFAMLLFALTLQIYSLKLLSELADSCRGASRRRRAGAGIEPLGGRIIVFGAFTILFVAPLFVAYCSAGLMDLAPFREYEGHHDEGWGNALASAFYLGLGFSLVSSIRIGANIIRPPLRELWLGTIYRFQQKSSADGPRKSDA